MPTPSFLDVLMARRQGPEAVNEMTLNRVRMHVEKDEGWGIMSAFRDGSARRNNRSNQARLQNAVKSLGLSFFKLKGHWQTCTDPDVPWHKCPKESLKDTVEPSVFIIGINREQMITLGRRFKQEAVIYGGPETKQSAVLIDTQGSGAEFSIGALHPAKISQGYSRLAGRPGRSFAFFEAAPMTNTERLMDSIFSSSVFASA